MASAPVPRTATRDTIFYSKVEAYKPKYDTDNQCYCDYKMTVKEFNARGKAIKCGLCDYEHIFYKPLNFNAHMKSDKHLRKLNELNARHRAANNSESETSSIAESVITSDATAETSMPALLPAPLPVQRTAEEHCNFILSQEVDRLYQVIRQRDAQLANLKQAIIYFGEYLKNTEAL